MNHRNECLGKAFVAALLLTGSAEKAEAAVLEGIKLLELDETCETLVNETLKAAIEMRPDIESGTAELEQLSSILPRELHPVIHLSPHFRQCFVLRILVGWPREICARLLDLETRQIEEHTHIAILRLAFGRFG
jgi:hypothetical protein